MWKVGAVRAARACSACARPISPPSAVTAALLDMFCGLNGRTRRPRLANGRARPATISDLPTSEPVPWNMMARAVMGGASELCRVRQLTLTSTSLELYAPLRLHTRREVMLHQRHLRHQVGRSDKLRLGVAAADHPVQIAPPRL